MNHTIQKAQKGNRVAAQEILDQYNSLVYKYVGKYKVPSHIREELAQEARIGILKAIPKFDESREIKFITFAFFWMQREVSNFIRNYTKQEQIKLNAPVDSDNSIVFAYYPKVKKALSHLSPIEGDIIIKTYGFAGKEYKNTEIAKAWGLTPSRISQLRKIALEKIQLQLGDNYEF